MATVKTAISLENKLFEQIEALAKEQNISRSRLLALAAEAYVAQYQNQKLLEAINEVYNDNDPSKEDTILLAQMKGKQRRVGHEW